MLGTGDAAVNKLNGVVDRENVKNNLTAVNDYNVI